MSTTTITITVPSNAFGTLAKLYSAIQDTGARAQVNHNGGVVEAPSAAEVVKRKPGRPRKTATPPPAQTAEVGAQVKRGRGRPKKVKAEDVAEAPADGGDIEEKFSKWHSSQKTDSGRGKYFSAGEVKQLLPKWEAALKEYLQAAGAAAEGGRTTKNWSIARLKREAQQAHGAGGPTDDQEGSPSSKPRRARSKFSATAAVQAAKRKPRGRAAKKTTDH